MVIRYFDFPSVFSIPDETYPPLIVDADAVLTGPVTGKRFQSVSRRVFQLVNVRYAVQENQLLQCSALYRFRKFPGPLALGYITSVSVPVTPNHICTIPRCILACFSSFAFLPQPLPKPPQFGLGGVRSGGGFGGAGLRFGAG